ncbi:MAG: DNA alkylation repair protein [Bacillota bacterium]|jgi:transposase-like protein
MTADLSGEALIESLLERIRAFCRANADEKIVVKYAKYFKEGYDAYGVDGKASTEEAKRIYMEYRDTLGFEGFLDLCDLLMESGKYEESGFVIRFMNLFSKEFSRETFARVGQWFEGKVRNWAISDSLCADVLSPMLAKSIVSLDDFRPWTESTDRWKRRAVYRTRKPRYSEEQKQAAIKYYLEHGRNLQRSIRALGYPNKATFRQWLDEALPARQGLHSKRRPEPRVELTSEQKQTAVVDLVSRKGPAREVAAKYGVSRAAMYGWKKKLLGKEDPVTRKGSRRQRDVNEKDVEALRADVELLKEEKERLEEANYRLRLENDVLRVTAEILKKTRAPTPRD